MNNKIYSFDNDNKVNTNTTQKRIKEQSEEDKVIKAIDILRKSKKNVTINEIKIVCVKENKKI